MPGGSAGYSGTPLAKKLGIIEGSLVTVVGEPDSFRFDLAPIPNGVTFRTALRGKADVVVIFSSKRRDFERKIESAGRMIFLAGGVWFAWPKKASKVPTDITEDTVREIALPLGLVDNKVCAIDEIWSGLRVVWRKELR